MATKTVAFDVVHQMATHNAQATLKLELAKGDTVAATFTTPADMSGKATRGVSWDEGAWLSFTKNAGNAKMVGEFNGHTLPGLMEVQYRLRALRPMTTYTAYCTVDDDVPEGMLWVRLNIPVPFATDKSAHAQKAA